MFNLALLFLLVSSPSHAAESGDHWEKVPSSALPALAPEGDLAAFRLALKRQTENCSTIRTKKLKICGSENAAAAPSCDEAVLGKLGTLSKNAKNWKELYEKAKTAFDWYRYKAPPEKVLFTGYNSPLFNASPVRTEKFAYPIYGLPPDLVVQDKLIQRRTAENTLVPYYDRKEIDEGALKGKKLELAWLEAPTDILRLQIEGSGVLRYPDGKEIGANYAGKNGRSYVSIFKTLKARGVDKQYLTFPGLSQYHRDHPAELREALNQSPSYVFFSLTKEPPCGASRVYVTAGHSIAVDPNELPLGAAVLLSATRPADGTDMEAKVVPHVPFTRFAFAQDTGGAIKGAHVDVYWGTGDYAMLASNTMQGHGDLFLLKEKKK